MVTMEYHGTAVGVVGLGYAGLPLAVAFAETGYSVVGVDIDEERIAAIRNGDVSVDGIVDRELVRYLNDELKVTLSYDDLGGCDAVCICVPTPLYEATEAPDMSYVADAVDRLADVIKPGTAVVLESTVYPGATEEVIVPRLEQGGYTIGDDVYVAFSPERIDPGNEAYGVREIPKVLGGVTEDCADRTEALYGPVFDEVVRVGSATEAELVKLLENTFRAVNIAFINELAIVADALDVDIWNVIDAAATKPFGFMPFYPGPGFGGHCIPIDPAYLTWRAHRLGVETQFIELAARVNQWMPRFVVSQIEELLDSDGPRLGGSDLLVLGVSYKPGVADTRESPAHEVMSLLEQAGAEVAYHDPFVPTFSTDGRTYASIELDSDAVAASDCVVLLTNHQELDVDWIVDEARLLFDTRNATAGVAADHVHRL